MKTIARKCPELVALGMFAAFAAIFRGTTVLVGPWFPPLFWGQVFVLIAVMGALETFDQRHHRVSVPMAIVAAEGALLALIFSNCNDVQAWTSLVRVIIDGWLWQMFIGPMSIDKVGLWVLGPGLVAGIGMAAGRSYERR